MTNENKKKVVTDLEKSIELARKHEGLYGIRNREACCVAACQEMADWKQQQMIDKAAEWLRMTMDFFNNGEFNIEKFVKDFKKEMKGE